MIENEKVIKSVKDKRVWMIVEDEPSLRMMLSTAMMLIWDIEPLVFSDGFNAMAWLDQIEAKKLDMPMPELALLDMRMPGPQGHEIAERLRKVPATSKMAIVMMTAYRLDPEERETVLKMAKPEAMLSKPLLNLNDLRQTLEKAVDSTRPSPSTTEQPAKL
jgi:CheY-like chemotaxis protein